MPADAEPPARPRICAWEDGCDEPAGRRQRYCPAHLSAVLRAAHARKRGPGREDRYIDGDGYVQVRDASGRFVAEHRQVMEQLLGRPLRPYERVRHRNLLRSDNRPGNLELIIAGGIGTPATDVVCPHCGEPYARVVAP